MLIRKRSLGQCFLEDKNILRIEAKALNCENKRVLEIGPGDGRLSEIVLEQKPECLVLVEKDSRFVELLKEKFASSKIVQIIEGDILEVDLPKVDLIIGNIPYNISSPIIFLLPKLSFDYAILMVQEEFARKMVAKPNEENYGRLSVTSQIHFDITYLKKVSKNLFRPAPKVDSAIVKLVPRQIELSPAEEEVIRALFSHRNKTVRNALDNAKFEKDKIQKTGEFLVRRVRTLTKEECLKIAKKISK